VPGLFSGRRRPLVTGRRVPQCVGKVLAILAPRRALRGLARLMAAATVCRHAWHAV